MVFYILLFMLAFGALQGLLAILGLIVSRSNKVKVNFGIYLLGVNVYFAILTLGYVAMKQWSIHIYDGLGQVMVVFFFGGALALAVYNLYCIGLWINASDRAAQA